MGQGTGGSGGTGGGAGERTIDGGGGTGGTTVIITIPDASPDRAPTTHCGNGSIDKSELCDDGNTESGDGCSRICQIENNYECPEPGKACVNLAACGNGLLTSDEACDDANTIGGDGCSANCQGVEPGWQCRVPGKPCVPRCGDGMLTGAEACDDGNTANDDGCSATCKLEPGYKCEGSPSQCAVTACGDGKKEGAEGCDDGNTMPFDGCSQDCQVEPDCSGASCTSKCGDGIVLGEDCDDGNAASGDGCSSACQVEPGWTCKQPQLGESMMVPVIYRDFRFGTPAEFESEVRGDTACVGMVETDLDKDGKPVYTGIGDQGIESKASFATWYRTTPDVNHPTAGKMALWKNGGGGYVNRYGKNGEQWQPGVDGNPLFFPVDGDAFTPADEMSGAQVPGYYDAALPWDLDQNGERRMHNFSFTSEVRYWFKYESGKTYQLDFLGDDDVWVFINKKLALDLGGLHPPVPGSMVLDAAMASKLGSLQSGKVYEVAVFQAERHTTASSYKLTLNGFSAASTVCVPSCGDGVVVADEECDNGAQNSDTTYGGCTTKCRWGGFCGDGVVNGAEDCDNGKNNGIQYGADGCTFGCTRPHSCGDGRVDTDRSEECDLGDKNGVSLDPSYTPSSGAGAQVYCTVECKIPPGVVF